MSKFELGQTVRVTGDTTGTGHEFPTGTVGVISADEDGYYQVENDYRVETPDGLALWVGLRDLELVVSEPSSHARVLSAVSVIVGLDLPDQVKTSVIKTLVETL